MGTQIGLTVIFLFAFSFLLTINEMFYRRLQLKGEITRKLAHFTATLSTITFPYLFNDHWYVLALAIVFFIFLFVSRHRSYLKSIHEIDRISVGSFLLPAAIYMTFLISFKLGNKFLFILPMLVLAVCDPMAHIMGVNLQQYNHRVRILKWRLQKTWLGSLSFFISCLIICIIALYFNRQAMDLKVFWLALVISFVSTFTELLSWKGIDNLLIPVSVQVVLLLLL